MRRAGEGGRGLLEDSCTFWPTARFLHCLLRGFSGFVSCWAGNRGQIWTSLGIHFPQSFVNMKL